MLLSQPLAILTESGSDASHGSAAKAGTVLKEARLKKPVVIIKNIEINLMNLDFMNLL